ncbi:hypothetical protein RRG08_003560 [Elysia crispata]|uniref:Uncharacterized protein n=1 Tax=Elysia crispata TaxID=231223 RepID=A0AAE0Y6H4_9GAST|nr:hypothetical protein RRG08_003560 [Elysia crispata]
MQRMRDICGACAKIVFEDRLQEMADWDMTCACQGGRLQRRERSWESAVPFCLPIVAGCSSRPGLKNGRVIPLCLRRFKNKKRMRAAVQEDDRVTEAAWATLDNGRRSDGEISKDNGRQTRRTGYD